MDILFFAGIAIIFGFVGGKITNRLKFPAVVGYLLAGLALGPSIFKIFNLKLLDKMGGFNDLALGLVAFIIGSQMRLATLRRMGRGILTIIFSESLGAFLLVALGVYLLTHKLYLALIFGAMAPASAPAGTAVVLQEYRTKGPLTDALYAVVGLDDGLAIMIYAFSAALAKLFLNGDKISFFNVIEGPLIEILGAIVLGGLIGVVFGYFIRKLHGKDEILAVSLAAIFICTGLSKYFNVSLILANLSLGMVFANLFLLANRRAYQAAQSISLPIYIIFFVIAGAHLQIKLLPALGLLGLVYIIARIAGLMGGSFFGATISKQDPVIRKYLGLGILSQAGVAIGLAILVTREFGSLGQAGQNLAVLVINTIAATTIVFEIIGPIATKIAISKAGEIGKANKHGG
jgi:Kef-type K+ transport system membrane component KefB